MVAFFSLAWAIAPKFVHLLLHHDEGRVAKAPSLRIVEAEPAPLPRRHALSCHWERARDGSLVAHWVRDDETPSHRFHPASKGCLLDDIPAELIADAYNSERHGSVLALIALSRMARLNQSRREPSGR